MNKLDPHVRERLSMNWIQQTAEMLLLLAAQFGRKGLTLGDDAMRLVDDLGCSGADVDAVRQVIKRAKEIKNKNASTEDSKDPDGSKP